MHSRPTDLDGFPTPALSSLVCVRFLETHRDLRAWAARYGDLISEPNLELMCLHHILVAPWHTPAQLKLHNRLSTWMFASDTAVERARTLAEVEEILRRWRRAAEGCETDPDDQLIRCLADICAELRTAPLWPYLADQWLDLLEHTLAGLRTERVRRIELAAGGPPPSVEEYLAASDNIQVRWCYLSYWIAAGDLTLLEHLDTLLPALWESQVAIRWANDFRSVQRGAGESKPGDSYLLDLGLAELRDRALGAVRACAELLQPLLAAGVPEAIGLDRGTRTVVDFYLLSDYRPEGQT